MRIIRLISFHGTFENVPSDSFSSGHRRRFRTTDLSPETNGNKTIEYAITVTKDGSVSFKVPFSARRLRESCTSNRDCGVIFSECNESICVCREGFSEDNNDGFCRAPSKVTSYSTTGYRIGSFDFLELVCPKATKDGSTMETPVKGSGEICESYFDRGLDRIRHNCTNQEVSFCFTHGAVENFEGKQIGHCCPVPAESVLVPVCPLGVGLTDATCPEITGPDQPVVQKRTCPINTYECAGIPTR